MAKNGRYRFAGTENIAGSYELLARNDAGHLGRRILEGGKSRIRLVPANDEARDALRPYIPADWKMPSDRYFRFSCVVSADELLAAIETARAALKAVGKEELVEVKATMNRAKQAAAGGCSSSAMDGTVADETDDESDDDEAEEASH